MRWIPGLYTLIFVLASVDAAAAPLSIQTDTGAVRFEVEIADTLPEQEKGLMFRTRLPERTGMLFTYGLPPHIVRMWMRNTLIGLDMLFIDEHGVIVNMKEDAKPRDETVISSRYNVTSVLEIAGGSTKKYGISVGNTVSLEP